MLESDVYYPQYVVFGSDLKYSKRVCLGRLTREIEGTSELAWKCLLGLVLVLDLGFLPLSEQAAKLARHAPQQSITGVCVLAQTPASGLRNRAYMGWQTREHWVHPGTPEHKQVILGVADFWPVQFRVV